MKTKIFQIIQYFILLFIGFALLWLFLKNLDFNILKENISKGNFTGFYLVMLVSILVYVFRTLRWQMLIKSAGYQTKFYNAFAALSISYFVSFIIPRLGEVTRCLSVKKQHDIPFMALLGTVIIERIIDVICLLLMLLLTIVLQFNQIMEFMKENIFHPFYEETIVKIISGNIIVLIITISIILIGTALFFYFRKYTREKSPKIILKFIEGFKQGLLSISKLKEKKLFFFYTFSIWLGYYLMTYFWFSVFKETSVLGWGACLAIVSIGTIGRSIPIQGGGMGAYHFLVTNVIVLYGLSVDWGKTMATLIHLGQTFFTFSMGIVGLLIFFIVYWRKRNT